MVAGDGAERTPRAGQVIQQPNRARVCWGATSAHRPMARRGRGSGEHRTQGTEQEPHPLSRTNSLDAEGADIQSGRVRSAAQTGTARRKTITLCDRSTKRGQNKH